ncbi:MATE family efflux transporter [uncultured Pseudoflavonifractor sp.]|uniref:MATE family efflux transporter n=1 Tax=uncultured Pseudoflavonifractor sp. TaxID=1221379 RepID=UPI0025E3EF33|nr:MATE family efflux transporter [uncultured Pseudoflavonifractor sp.]
MENRLDREFRFFSLLRFALPSVVMMIFTSLYSIVDGMFVSRFVGEDALAALNIVFPVMSLTMAAGVMLATGGSAIVARRMGSGEEQSALEGFSLLTAVGAAVGAVFSVLGLAAVEPICRLLGGEGALMAYCVPYLRIIMLFGPMSILQLMFQSFFVTAGRPGLGLGLTVAAGVANMVLDYVFIVPVGMGVAGAALATVVGYCIPAVAGLAFFALRRQGLRFTRPKWDGRMLAGACFNGSSEMVSNLSSAVVTLLFNLTMLELLGPPGVSAITIVLYAQFLLTALYIGFSIGVAPVFSFNYGADNRKRLRSLFRSCLIFIAGSSVVLLLVALFIADGVVTVFSPRGSEVYDLAVHGFRLFAPMILFTGLNIFASALFTALSNGPVSALLSFLRTFGFLTAGLLLLPRLLGVDGVWLAVPVAELLSFGVSLWCFRWGGKRYGYA